MTEKDLLWKICSRAGELSMETMKMLRLQHPDNYDNEEPTYSGSQWKGVSKGKLIEEILYEEFDDKITELFNENS